MADTPLLSGFDPASFRDNITQVMTMGLPVSTDLKPTFHFKPTLTYPGGTKLDVSGKPIDPRITPTSTVTAPVQVPCAVEYTTDNSNDEGLAGTFWSDYATVTLLDTHYAQVSDAIEVDLSGRRYLIQKMRAVALGTVTVYQLQCFLKGTSND